MLLWISTSREPDSRAPARLLDRLCYGSALLPSLDDYPLLLGTWHTPDTYLWGNAAAVSLAAPVQPLPPGAPRARQEEVLA